MDIRNMDAVIAVAGLCQRSGTTTFEIGHVADDDDMTDITEMGWWCTATFRGAKLTVEDQPTPQHAADGLAHKILDGGWCVHCEKVTTTAQTEHGTYVPCKRVRRLKSKQLCRWRRVGNTWTRGCER